MKIITHKDMAALKTKAGESSRKRMNLNVHEQASDPIQRLFIAADRTSYFRAHRHNHSWEFALVLQGLFDVLVFDDTGQLTERISLGPQARVAAFEIPAGTWHAWIPHEDGSVFFECKQGPYNPDTAAEFAPWSPEEGSSEVTDFVQRLKTLAVGDMAS
ncbi:MAG: WbuC family cupin fold metalloprotein [Proteobacteria bacterium]|nr:WbuC family cupin fold metalloprotein [Pseudomonadota bacterium]